jgi:hypothetical protein
VSLGRLGWSMARVSKVGVVTGMEERKWAEAVDN